MLMGGLALVAGALVSSGAQAQCTGNATQFSGSAGLSAITSMISTVNTAFLTSGSAFVSTPNSAPDRQGGGVWARTAGGTVDTQGNNNFSGSFYIPVAPSWYNGGNGYGKPFTDYANISCHTKVQQDFTGFQAGQDIALLNTESSGINWHFGVLAGYVEANARDVTPGSSNGSLSANFDAPSAGIYTAFSKGDFFADAQARLDFFQSELSGQRLDARGYSVTGNAGYRFDLDGKWTLEPSVGGVFSHTRVDPLSVSGVLDWAVNNTIVSATVMGGNFQIQDVESALGRASLKLGTSLTLDGGQIVAYPFLTASVFREFAGNVTASLSGNGTVPAPAPYNYPFPYQGGGTLTVSRAGTYAQFGAGSAFQLADTGWLGYVRADYRTGDNIQGLSVNAGLRYQLNPGMASLKEGGSLKDGPAEGYDWTGVYVGASAGSAWGGTHWTYPGNSAGPDYAGYLVGGQAGYNYQIGKFVWGVEVDTGLANARGAKNCQAGSNFYSCEDDVGALGSLTGRLGYTWGRALFYGKGGLAFGEVTAGLNAPGGAATSATNWDYGWTAGAGVEFALTDRWSAMAEYMHYEFSPDVFTVAQNFAPSATTAGDTVRVGVNYHFGLR